MDVYKVIKKPHITEKASLRKEVSNQVTFEVHKKANKIEIRQAVEKLFKTKVVDVQTLNMVGKKRRMGKSWSGLPYTRILKEPREKKDLKK